MGKEARAGKVVSTGCLKKPFPLGTSGRQQRVHTSASSHPQGRELGCASSSAHQPWSRAAPRGAVNSPVNMHPKKAPRQSNKGVQSKYDGI